LKNGTIRKLGYGFLFAFNFHSNYGPIVSTKYRRVTDGQTNGHGGTSRVPYSMTLANRRRAKKLPNARAYCCTGRTSCDSKVRAIHSIAR